MPFSRMRDDHAFIFRGSNDRRCHQIANSRFVQITTKGDSFNGDVAVCNHADRLGVFIHNDKTADMFATHLKRAVMNRLLRCGGGHLMNGHVNYFERTSSHLMTLSYFLKLIRPGSCRRVSESLKQQRF